MTPDFRIHRDKLDITDFGAVLWALVEPVWPGSENDDTPEHLASATPGQRYLYSTLLFIRDVDNGGLEQAIWNLEPWLVELAIDGFVQFGASDHALAIRQALALLLGDKPPQSLVRRRRMIDKYLRSGRRDDLEFLNERLYGEERLWPKWQQYIDLHPAEFFLD